MKALTTLLALCPLLCQANSTIDDTQKDAHGANFGWIDTGATTSSGLVVAENALSGYAHGANIGWIHFGDNTPNDGVAYSNSSATDYGVNMSFAGELTGFAYGANIGWINFEQSQGKPKIDLSTGSFSGYAYGANVGWINLATLKTNSLQCVDSDNDTIADYWEMLHFGDLTTATATTDNDHDGHLDAKEYLANTDPQDHSSFFQLCITSLDVDNNEATLAVTVGAGRDTSIISYTSLDGQANSVEFEFTYAPLTSPGTFSEDILLPLNNPSKYFFRASAQKPLTP